MNIEIPTFADALFIFKTPSGIARALKIKPQAIYQWGGKLPPLRVYQLSSHIKGLVTAGAEQDAEVLERIESRSARAPDKSAA